MLRIPNKSYSLCSWLSSPFDNLAWNYCSDSFSQSPGYNDKRVPFTGLTAGIAYQRGASVLHMVWHLVEDNTDFPSMAPQGSISRGQGLERLTFRSHSALLTPFVLVRMSPWESPVWEHTIIFHLWMGGTTMAHGKWVCTWVWKQLVTMKWSISASLLTMVYWYFFNM